MSLDQLKEQVAHLQRAEQRELIAFLVARQREDAEAFKAKLAEKIDDCNSANWMTFEEMKKRSAENETNYKDHISLDPNIRSGKPCIKGTRIAVADVFDYLGGGMTIPEILDDFPDLRAEDIQACFAFAADRDRRLSVLPHEVAL